MAELEVTKEMIEAGVRALYSVIPMDIANPILPEEQIVETIYLAMRRAETRGGSATRQSPLE
jgi:hypothetical protein